jgi:tetratricopeptide (TPR) repeat protein
VLAQAYDLHAEQEMVAGRWERTMDLVRRAHALRQVMVDNEPDPDDAEWWISQSIGRLAYATPDVRLAREEALRALAIQERYYARRPFSYHGLLDVSFARRNAAYALQRCGSIDSAIALYRQCLDVRRVIAGADASDLRGRFHLANAAAWLAGGFLAAGQTDSALTYAHLGHRIGWSVATATNAPVWADEGLRFHRLTVARALRHAGREAESDSVYAIVCREAVGVPLDKVRFARGWIERGHGRLAAGDRAMADSCFSAAEQTLLLATVPLEFRSADATPFADVALMLVHLAQVAGRDSGRRRRVLEKAMALPRIDGDPRPVRPLIENELACALAEQAQRDESIRLLRGALARGPKGDLRSALQSNLAALERTGPGAGHSIQPYDASRDPYAKLDLLLFRMIGIWGEHPVPPASRLATARS